jgi:hypothetical protein
LGAVREFFLHPGGRVSRPVACLYALPLLGFIYLSRPTFQVYWALLNQPWVSDRFSSLIPIVVPAVFVLIETARALIGTIYPPLGPTRLEVIVGVGSLPVLLFVLLFFFVLEGAGGPVR